MPADRQRYEAERKTALASAERLAALTGHDVLPLELVAPLLPTLPEWEEFRVPRRRTKRR